MGLTSCSLNDVNCRSACLSSLTQKYVLTRAQCVPSCSHGQIPPPPPTQACARVHLQRCLVQMYTRNGSRGKDATVVWASLKEQLPSALLSFLRSTEVCSALVSV